MTDNRDCWWKDGLYR